MFERFTHPARKVVVLAQDEARALDHGHIGTEHLLLGLLSEEEGVAASALRALDVGVDACRSHIEEISGRGSVASPNHIPFTPRSKEALELSFHEALRLGHDFIGPEHILLGLLQTEGVALEVLERLGAPSASVRAALERFPSAFSEVGGKAGHRPRSREQDASLER